MLTTTVMADGTKNLTLQVSGIIEADEQGKILLRINPVPTKFRLSNAVWLIQEKATLLLWWVEYKHLIIPMESRNSLRLEHGIHMPRDWDGVLSLTWLNINEPKHIMLALDFDK